MARKAAPVALAPLTEEERRELEAAQRTLCKIMGKLWVTEHHMTVGRAYHGLAALTGYYVEEGE